ncbi:uncharacterized protein LOC127879736 isoform X2 [Dreissena polymorpha]|uniref:uncharacterized protein LOC127879736 isoform X2 n=1 Tax=Dreissena polymorpha TaxID=45954 RepID=UPI00226532C7|nr:uncharacterized protein LOC127879736 isoform X2 [Dreissena polymorpha]
MENKGRDRRPYASLWIVSGIISFIGYILHVVGFATNYWTDLTVANTGLWRVCVDNKDCSNVGVDNVDWFKAVQALTIIGIILGFIGIIVISFIICFPRHYRWRIAACKCAVLAAGGGLMLIGGLILCVDMCINRGYRRGAGKVRNRLPKRLYYESNYPQELRAPPYDIYKKPHPEQEPPRVYEWYPVYPHDKKEPFDRIDRYDWGDKFDRYDTLGLNYGRYDPGPITYVAYEPYNGRKTGPYDYN